MSSGDDTRPSSAIKSTLTVRAILGGVLLCIFLVCGGVLALLLMPAVAKIPDAAARTAMASQLKQIAVAFYTDHDKNMKLPAHAIYSADGKTPLLSWRVALLPYMEQMALYQQFKLDEPWDSEHNKRLIPLMPAVYSNFQESDKGDGLTRIQIFTGPGTVFDGPNQLKLSDIASNDGTANTLLVVLASEPVIWTKPADLVLPPAGGKMPALHSFRGNSTLAALCDTSIHPIPSGLEQAILRGLVTPRGGEQIDWDKFWK